MQRIVIDIPDKKFNFFMELIKNLGFKKVKHISIEHQEGKIKLQSAKDFLNEL